MDTERDPRIGQVPLPGFADHRACGQSTARGTRETSRARAGPQRRPAPRTPDVELDRRRARSSAPARRRRRPRPQAIPAALPRHTRPPAPAANGRQPARPSRTGRAGRSVALGRHDQRVRRGHHDHHHAASGRVVVTHDRARPAPPPGRLMARHRCPPSSRPWDWQRVDDWRTPWPSPSALRWAPRARVAVWPPENLARRWPPWTPNSARSTARPAGSARTPRSPGSTAAGRGLFMLSDGPGRGRQRRAGGGALDRRAWWTRRSAAPWSPSGYDRDFAAIDRRRGEPVDRGRTRRRAGGRFGSTGPCSTCPPGSPRPGCHRQGARIRPCRQSGDGRERARRRRAGQPGRRHRRRRAAAADGWPILVADDRTPSGATPAQVVRLASGARGDLVVSCRHWRRGGRVLHHIVDPRTGLPADGPWRTASVAAATCAEANAASTAAIVAGRGAEAGWRRHGLPGRLVAHDGAVRLRGRLAARRRRPHRRAVRAAGCTAERYREVRDEHVAAAAGSQGLWFVSRASGLVLLVLFSVVMVLGVATRLGSAPRPWPASSSPSCTGRSRCSRWRSSPCTSSPRSWTRTSRSAGRRRCCRSCPLPDARDRPRNPGRRPRRRRAGHQPGAAPAGLPGVAGGALAGLSGLARGVRALPDGRQRPRIWWVALIEWGSAAAVATAVVARADPAVRHSAPVATALGGVRDGHPGAQGDAGDADYGRAPQRPGGSGGTPALDRCRACCPPTCKPVPPAWPTTSPATVPPPSSALTGSSGKPSSTRSSGPGSPAAAALHSPPRGSWPRSRARTAPVVVANGTEGEPASAKDKVLLARSPHLVLDGAVARRRDWSAPAEAVVVAHPPVRDVRRRGCRASDGLLDSDRVRIRIDDRCRPVRRRRGQRRGELGRARRPDSDQQAAAGSPSAALGGRPTLVQNVETLAHLALIARYGAGVVPRHRHAGRARVDAGHPRRRGAPALRLRDRDRHARPGGARHGRRPVGAACGAADRRLLRYLGRRRPRRWTSRSRRPGLAAVGAECGRWPGRGAARTTSAGWSRPPGSSGTSPTSRPASAGRACSVSTRSPASSQRLAEGGASDLGNAAPLARPGRRPRRLPPSRRRGPPGP